MKDLAFRFADWLCLTFVFALALGLRAGYLIESTGNGQGQPAWAVQGDGPLVFAAPEQKDKPAGETHHLIRNLRAERWFGGPAPLADAQEETASISPGYPWLAAFVGEIAAQGDSALLWLNAALGSLTALLYFLFARRAFRSLAVGTMAGILTACHPYWIINVGEVADGTLASFLLAFCLFLGTRAAQEGGALSSLLFGISLAASALVRAAFLPFAFVALLWFLVRVRKVKQSWLCALLAFLGFANGLAPWTVRNWQTFQEPLPIVSSTWLHLWMGNNPRATGGVLEESEMRFALGEERTAKLLFEKNQARRYSNLAHDTVDEIRAYPGDYLNRRLQAGAVFLFGEPWMRQRDLAVKVSTAIHADVVESPGWLIDVVPGALVGSLLLMLALGLWGWRRSIRWRKTSGLATLAAIWIPLPYILGHAGILVGPRLPVDGVWLTFAALGLVGLCGFGPPRKKHEEEEDDEPRTP